MMKTTIPCFKNFNESYKMSDPDGKECNDCEVEKLNISNICNCTRNSLRKTSSNLKKCNTINDIHNVFANDDSILYFSFYLMLCWIIIHTINLNS